MPLIPAIFPLSNISSDADVPIKIPPIRELAGVNSDQLIMFHLFMPLAELFKQKLHH